MDLFEILRAFFGLIYVIVLPGFIATWALFPEKDDIEILERLILVMFFSVSLSVFPVMFLNYWPGIQFKTVTVFLINLAVIAFISIIAVYRTKLLRHILTH